MKNRANQITITGHPGGGKTTAAKLLSHELSWDYFYTGAVQRQLAAEMGITTLEFNVRSETDPSLNEKIDAVYAELNKSEKPMVVDARLAWHFMPNSFKVRFEVPVAIGAQRVFEYARREDEQYKDIDAAVRALTERRQSERTHYFKSYDLDVEDPKHFDLILDTAYSLPERNVSFVRAAFSLWYKGIRLPRYWSSPRSLVPTNAPSDDDGRDLAAVEQMAVDMRSRGYDTLSPILAVGHAERVYIIDGHKRVAAAWKAGCDFIPVVFVEEGSDVLKGYSPADFIAHYVDPAHAVTWQDKYGLTL